VPAIATTMIGLDRRLVHRRNALATRDRARIAEWG
jgi:hypothetical protein